MSSNAPIPFYVFIPLGALAAAFCIWFVLKLIRIGRERQDPPP